MIQNIPLKIRLFALLFVPLLIFAVSCTVLLQLNNNNTNSLTNALYETSGKATSLILNADRDMYQAMSAYQMAVSTTNPMTHEEQVAFLKENVQQANERVTEATRIITRAGLLQGFFHPTSNRSILDIVGEYHLLFDQWANQAYTNSESSSWNGSLDAQFTETFDKARVALNEYGEILDEYAHVQIQEIHQQNQQMMWIMYSILLVIIAVIAWTGILLIRQLGSTVNNVLSKTKLVSEGDLRSPLQQKYTKDELGQTLQAVDSMIVKMRELIGNISTNTNHVKLSSENLAHSSSETAAAANHVAANIQEVTLGVETQARISEESSRAIEEMTIGIQRIAESATVISEHSSNTSLQAEQGNQMLQRLKGQIAEIIASIETLSGIVHSLNQRSEKIGDIVVQITEFSNQTNILSLNASIEAARAGEHGRGFAVVASEIRSLAANSLHSAGVINALIQETQADISNASSFMNKTTEEAGRGQQIMDEVTLSFDHILQSVKHMVSQIHETSAITEQMSASSEEVSASMEQNTSTTKEVFDKTQNVAAATEEQLAQVEQISQASDQLRDIVTDLNQSVSYFKV